MVIFVSVLVFQLLIVALGVLQGYKRGAGRSAVRLVELLMIGAASLLLGRLIASKLAAKAWALVVPMIDGELSSLLASLESLVVGFVGALAVPLLFAILFSLLGLLTKILMKKRGRAIVKAITKKQEAPSNKRSRLVGMGIGAISAAVVALALFSPTYTAISLVGGLSDESIALIGSLTGSAAVEQASAPEGALSLRPALLEKKAVSVEGLLMELRDTAGVVAPSLSLKLATATTPEGARYDAVEEAVALTNAIGAAMAATKSAQSDSETGEPAANPMETITQVAGAAIPHLAGQPFAKELVATAVSAVGTHLQNGGELAGLSANTGDMMTDAMVRAMSEAFASTTAENLSDTANTLFGIDLNAIEEAQKADKSKETAPAPEVTTPAPEDTTPAPEDTTPAESDGATEPDETMGAIESSKEPDETKAPTPKPVIPTAQGALNILSKVDFSNATEIFADEAQCASLIAAVYVLDANPTFSPVISAIGTLGDQLMQENREALIPNLNEEDLHGLYQSLLDSVAAEGKYKPSRSIEYKAAGVKAKLVELAVSYQHPITDAQAELGAICIAAHFFTPENMADPGRIHFDEFAAYIGVK